MTKLFYKSVALFFNWGFCIGRQQKCYDRKFLTKNTVGALIGDFNYNLSDDCNQYASTTAAKHYRPH